MSVQVLTGLFLSLLISTVVVASPARWQRSTSVTREAFLGLDARGIFTCISENGARWVFKTSAESTTSFFMVTDKSEEPFYSGVLTWTGRNVVGSLTKYQADNRRDDFPDDLGRERYPGWSRNPNPSLRFNVQMRAETNSQYILKLTRFLARDVYWTCQ